MSVSNEYAEYVMELLEPIGRLHKARFFGGVALSHDGVQFAMLMDNSLYFVVDDSTRPNYEQRGMHAFSYLTKKGRIQIRKYFELPEAVLTDSEQVRQWAQASLRIASASKKASSGKRATTRHK